MRTVHLRGILAVAALVAVAGCSSATNPTATPAAGGGGGGNSTPAAGANGGNAGGMPDACSLLTTAEIQGAVGFAVKDGVASSGTGTSSCNWDGATDDSQAVGVSVQTYDDTLWQTGASTANAKPVSGLGDAAYSGWPTSNGLNVKIKGYMVGFGVIDFKKTNDVIVGEDTALAKLVLPRL